MKNSAFSSGIDQQIKQFFSLPFPKHKHPKRLATHLYFIFSGINLFSKQVLDVGGGEGLLSLYAAACGASAICLEPEFDGSSRNMIRTFHDLNSQLNPQIGSASLEASTFQDFSSQQLFDVLVLANSVNHLNEEATISLRSNFQSKLEFKEVFKKMFSMLKPGGKVIITDCARNNFFGDLNITSPFMPSIEWHKHQNPKVWVSLLEDVGFVDPSVKWSTPNSLGVVGRYVFGSRLFAYFLFSHFRLELHKPLES